MFIKEITIKNFKSIKDLTFKPKKVNILYGENNVGKSNILKALDFALNFQIDVTSDHPRGTDIIKTYFYGNPETFFYKLTTENDIIVKCKLLIEKEERNELIRLINGFNCSDVFKKCLSNLKNKIKKGGIIDIEVGGFKRGNELEKYIKSIKFSNELFFNQLIIDRTETGYSWDRKGKFMDADEKFVEPFIKEFLYFISDNFTHLHFLRNFETQETEEKTIDLFKLKYVNPSKLNEILYRFYITDDFKFRKMFEEIVEIFDSLPFDFGKIHIAKDIRNKIKIYVKKEEIYLPLSYLGSGPQQILFFVVYFVLNKNNIFGIEEPEMNLSPKNQMIVFESFLKYVFMKESLISQLFITTHSPIFGEKKFHKKSKTAKMDVEYYFVDLFKEATRIRTQSQALVETYTHWVYFDEDYLEFLNEPDELEGIVEIPQDLPKKLKNCFGKKTKSLKRCGDCQFIKDCMIAFFKQGISDLQKPLYR